MQPISPNTHKRSLEPLPDSIEKSSKHQKTDATVIEQDIVLDKLLDDVVQAILPFWEAELWHRAETQRLQAEETAMLNTTQEIVKNMSCDGFFHLPADDEQKNPVSLSSFFRNQYLAGVNPYSLEAMKARSELQECLEKTDLNALPDKGYAILCHCIEYEQEDVIELLLGKGVSLDSPSGSSALNLVAKRSSSITKRILYHLPLACSISKPTQLLLLQQAIDCQDEELMQLLVSKGVDVNCIPNGVSETERPAIFYAAARSAKMTKLLLDLNANPAYKKSQKIQDHAFYSAVEARAYHIAQLFLDQKSIDPETHPATWKIILAYFKKENAHAAEYLISFGLNLSYKKKGSDETRLQQLFSIASAKQNAQLLRICVKYGCDIQSLMTGCLPNLNNGQMSLKKVMKKIETFLSSGGNINDVDKDGFTVLTAFLYNRRTACGKKKKWTPFQQDNDYDNFINWLLEKGASTHIGNTKMNIYPITEAILVDEYHTVTEFMESTALLQSILQNVNNPAPNILNPEYLLSITKSTVLKMALQKIFAANIQI